MTRAPGRLDPLSKCRHRSSRLAGDHQPPHVRGGQVDLVLGGDFGHVQGIAGRAEDDGCTAGHGQFQAGDGAESTAGNHQHPAGRGRVVGTPEADERAEGEGHQHAVLGSQVRGVHHVLPGVDPPGPVFRGVQDDHRSTASSRRAMKPHVVLQGIGQIRGQVTAADAACSSSFVVKGSVASCSSDVKGRFRSASLSA